MPYVRYCLNVADLHKQHVTTILLRIQYQSRIIVWLNMAAGFTLKHLVATPLRDEYGLTML